MTTIFYDGENLVADTCMLIPTTPSEFTKGVKIFRSQDNTFAYGWSGPEAVSTESRIEEVERALNLLCECLCSSKHLDRTPWEHYRKYIQDHLRSTLEGGIVDSLDFLLMTKAGAWSVAYYGSTRYICPIPLRSGTGSVGTGHGLIIGIHGQTKAVQESYRILMTLDPLTNDELVVIPQDSLDPYVLGAIAG